MKGGPIACTLSGADMTARFAAIAKLNSDALQAVRRIGLTIELDYDLAAADRVREFVRLEQRCCAFLEFAVHATPDLIRVRVTAPSDAKEAAETIFDQFLSRESALMPRSMACGC